MALSRSGPDPEEVYRREFKSHPGSDAQGGLVCQSRMAKTGGKEALISATSKRENAWKMAEDGVRKNRSVGDEATGDSPMCGKITTICNRLLGRTKRACSPKDSRGDEVMNDLGRTTAGYAEVLGPNSTTEAVSVCWLSPGHQKRTFNFSKATPPSA